MGKSEIIVVGIADESATDFKDLCTANHFIGITPSDFESEVVLRGLGDLAECAITELLDCLVVAAGQMIGGQMIGANFYLGHEDLGPRGPWDQYTKVTSASDTAT